MAEYNPSKIIKDGNTYNFRDDTKIPLAGSNQISGDLIPATDNAYNLGNSTYGFKDIYTNKIYLKDSTIFKLVDNSYLLIGSASVQTNGANLVLNGKDTSTSMGEFKLEARDGTNTRQLIGKPNGTLTWNGQAIQYISDKRLKQQISQIDDDLLTAWEDVNPVQFKYNDAVDTKKDKARLHTGYVVQQIDSACKSHGVDISDYGLYCHEEYPQETEEIEVEQKDGTKVKETKVIREASEHYSLRYTEALIVECAYLRKCIKELRTEIEQLKSSK